MSISAFSHALILQYAAFSRDDKQLIAKRRGQHNQIGFAYQLAFVRIAFRFPMQNPLEIVNELLVYVSVQLNIKKDAMAIYAQRRQTITEHRKAIMQHLELKPFSEVPTQAFEKYLFEEGCRLEQTGPLISQAKSFLRSANILLPADDTLQRIIVTQRQAARTHIHERIDEILSQPLKNHLDEWLLVDEAGRTPLFRLKQPPGRPTPKSMLRLSENLRALELSGVLDIDLSWLNNNYQRTLARFASRYPADRLSQLIPTHRHAVLVCFLRQVYCDTLDHMLDMYHKVMTTVYNRAQDDVDQYNRQQRHHIRAALSSFSIVAPLLLSDTVPDGELRETVFDKIDRSKLQIYWPNVQMTALQA
jgi:hypothetical protein